MYVFYFLRCLLALICSVCELYFYQVITLFKMGLKVETSVVNRIFLHNLDYSVYHFKQFRLMQLLFSRAWGERWARTSPGWLWPSRSSARACLLAGQLIYLPQRPCTLFYSPTVLGKDFDFTMTDFVNGFLSLKMDPLKTYVFYIFKVKPEPGPGYFYDCLVSLLKLAFCCHSRTAHCHRCRL